MAPKEGHAVVNVGDGLSLLTNGLFRSCLHWVGPLPGRPSGVRYSFAYLVRAEDKTPMTGVKSASLPTCREGQPVLTSGELLSRKFGPTGWGTLGVEGEKVVRGEKS